MGIFSRKNTESAPVATFDEATTAVQDISGAYTIDPTHTRLGFSARHAMVTTVRGQFDTFAGTAVIDTANPANSSVELTIQVDSITTGNVDRDGHLKTADFFDAENHPTITFTSTQVSRDGNEWEITGDLTIAGTSHPVTIDFEETGSAKDPYGNIRVGFEGATAISRKDWGLTYNAALETGGVLISDKIKLDFDVSAIANA